jgi:hypothetical protein
MMEGYRVAFIDVEEGLAKFTLYKDDEVKDDFIYPVDDLPDGVKMEHLDDQFRPEFDDEGNIVELHYDEELTEQKREDFKKAVETPWEELEDN